jgi:hypothetical protein
MGSVEQGIIKMAENNNLPIPDRILNKPILEEGLELYMQAFYDLDTERDYSMQAGPIKWSDIVGYAHYYDFDEEQTDALLFFMRRMDNFRLKELNKKSET